MKLNELLIFPSIRTRLDIWLAESEFGGKQKFENNIALEKFEKIIIDLKNNYDVPFDVGFKIATNSAEALIEELYN